MQTSRIEALIAEHTGNSGEFPRVLSVTGDTDEFQLQLEVTEDLDGFRGHFPGNPVLAGVVQLHWAARFSSLLFNYPRVPMEIKRLKFKNIVQPPARLTLTLQQTSDMQVQFEFSSLQHGHSSGLMVFEQHSA